MVELLVVDTPNSLEQVLAATAEANEILAAILWITVPLD